MPIVHPKHAGLHTCTQDTTSLTSAGLTLVRTKETEQAATRSLGRRGVGLFLLLLLLPLFRGLSLQNASILSVGLKSPCIGYKAEMERRLDCANLFTFGGQIRWHCKTE